MASVVNPQLGIPERLSLEANNRVATSSPKVEDVFAALTKAGVKMSPPAQHMAATYDARYCAGAKTDDQGLAISSCEYANEADAIKGRDLSENILKMVAHRKVWRDKTTILSIIEANPTPANDALQAKIVGIFTKL